MAYRYLVWPADKTPDNNAAVLMSPTVALKGTEAMSITVSDLEPGKAYYWKVLASDDKGATVESESRRFEVKQ